MPALIAAINDEIRMARSLAADAPGSLAARACLTSTLSQRVTARQGPRMGVDT